MAAAATTTASCASTGSTTAARRHDSYPESKLVISLSLLSLQTVSLSLHALPYLPLLSSTLPRICTYPPFSHSLSLSLPTWLLTICCHSFAVVPVTPVKHPDTDASISPICLAVPYSPCRSVSQRLPAPTFRRLHSLATHPALAIASSARAGVETKALGIATQNTRWCWMRPCKQPPKPVPRSLPQA